MVWCSAPTQRRWRQVVAELVNTNGLPDLLSSTTHLCLNRQQVWHSAW